jgi:hypothetical protein
MGSFVILEEYPHAGCSDVGSNPNLMKKKGCSDVGSWAIRTRPVLKKLYLRSVGCGEAGGGICQLDGGEQG